MNTLHLIALGANLPGVGGAPPRAACEQALTRLAAVPGLSVLLRSRWFSSAPQPPSGQPRYVNGVALLQGRMAPAALLAVLQGCEAAAGRVRGAPDAARTLDLDIIDMAGTVRDAPDPILPHPRAHQRAFVLLPLRDVAPWWVHPRLGQTIQNLIQVLPPQDVHPL